MRRILRAGAGLILSFGVALAPLPAQAEQSAAASDAAQAQANALAQDKSADAAPAKPLIIGRDVLTHIDRIGLGDLAVRWEEWRMKDNREGIYFCDEKQKGAVWYLGRGDSHVQQCRIPADKYMLVPVARALQAEDEPSEYLDDGEGDEIIHTSHGDILAADKKLSCPEAVKAVSGWADALGLPEDSAGTDGIETMVFALDGRNLLNLRPFRVSFKKCLKSPLSGGKPYALDGYWVLLPPLSPGHHILYTKYWNPLADCDGMREQIYEIDVPKGESGAGRASAAPRSSGADARNPDSDKVQVSKYGIAEFMLEPGKDVLMQYQKQNLSDLAIRWTERMLKTDGLKNTLSDNNNGKPCYGDAGDSLWYLGYSAGDCILPENTYLALSLNYDFQYAFSGSRADCSSARSRVKEWAGNPDTVSALAVDGRKLKDIRAFYVSPDSCPLSPADSVSHPGMPYALGGYWAVLPPLGKGYHEICIGKNCSDVNDDTPYASDIGVQLYRIYVQ